MKATVFTHLQKVNLITVLGVFIKMLLNGGVPLLSGIAQWYILRYMATVVQFH